MNDVLKLVQLALLTGKLAERRRVSLLVVSNAENGKSMVLGKFRLNPGVKWIDDITAYGLLQALFTNDAYKKLHHVVISDLNVILSRSKETANGVMAILLPMMWDGIQEVATFNTKLRLPQPVQLGLITAMTPGVLAYRYRHWAVSGNLRRFLPVSYQYGNGAIDDVCDAIEREEIAREPAIALPPMEPQVRVQTGAHLNRRLRELSRELVAGLNLPGETMHGFSFEDSLISLAKAQALIEGRQLVLLRDIEEIQRLSKYMNYQARAL